MDKYAKVNWWFNKITAMSTRESAQHHVPEPQQDLDKLLADLPEHTRGVLHAMGDHARGFRREHKKFRETLFPMR